jgi:hypothetical protein
MPPDIEVKDQKVKKSHALPLQMIIPLRIRKENDIIGLDMRERAIDCKTGADAGKEKMRA